MKKLTQIWIDMDNTIFDFGTDEESLKKMKEPGYYSQLQPFEGVLDAIGALADSYSISIISGIPDLKMHGKWLGDMSPAEYQIYYRRVMQNKLWLLDHYFGKDFFDSIEFTRASESKGQLVRTRWAGCSKDTFSMYMLLDDYSKYCIDWRKNGGVALHVNDKSPLIRRAGEILRGEF